MTKVSVGCTTQQLSLARPQLMQPAEQGNGVCTGRASLTWATLLPNILCF